MYVILSPYPYLADSMYRSGADGIHVHVGKPPLTRKVHVSKAAMRANSVLRDCLSDGATVTNTDPIIFEIALQYVEQSNLSLLGKMRSTSRNPFQDLLGCSDMMLKLVKAWHLGDMLDLKQMQNEVIDTFSGCYLDFLEDGVQIPLLQEPFDYLRIHMGNFSRCEKFLIEFHAGLARLGGGFRAEELEYLPRDVVTELERRYEYLTVWKRLGDRIAQGSTYFMVSDMDNTRRATLRVLPPPATPPWTPTASSQNRPDLDRSASSMSTMLSAAPITPPWRVARRGHRPYSSLPVNLGQPGDHDRAISRAIAFEEPFQRAHHPHNRSTSISVVPARRPSEPDSPGQQRKRSRLEAAAESSEDEGGIALSPNFRLRFDSQQRSWNGTEKHT